MVIRNNGSGGDRQDSSTELERDETQRSAEKKNTNETNSEKCRESVIGRIDDSGIWWCDEIC